MHKIPKNLDFSPLFNQTLIQVCIGENEVILNFHPDARILATVPIVVSHQDGVYGVYSNKTDDVRMLICLLGMRIQSVSMADQSTIQLNLDSGAQIKIADAGEDYESYELSFGKESVVV